MSRLTAHVKAFLAMAFVGLAAVPVGAQAAAINAALSPGVNTFEDTNAERVLTLSEAGTLVQKNSGNLIEGDVIQAILNFQTVNNQNPAAYGAQFAFPYQLTAVGELKINTITQADAAGNNLDIPCLVEPLNCFFTFVAAGGLVNSLEPGAMVAIYENELPVPAAERFNTLVGAADGLGRASSGTLISTLGLGTADDFWHSVGPLDVGLISGLTPGAGQRANGDFGLSILSNPGGLFYLPLAMLSPVDLEFHDVIGDSSIFGAATGVNNCTLINTTNCWIASSNTNVLFAVPEPGTLGLLGAVLLAAGFGFRRRA